jgi:hypothetical protein
MDAEPTDDEIAPVFWNAWQRVLGFRWQQPSRKPDPESANRENAGERPVLWARLPS